MIESPKPYQINTTLDGHPVIIQVRDHYILASDEIVFEYEVLDVDEDCYMTLTPEQTRAIWNVMMTDLETICHGEAHLLWSQRRAPRHV